MDRLTKDERKKVFISELHLLLEEDYINGRQFNEIARAHHRFYADQPLEKEIAFEPVDQKAPLQPQIQNKKPAVVMTPKKKPEKKKLTGEEIRERNITWSLNLGVILLLIGGLFVATSNWATMPDWLKSGLVGLVSLLFFGISFLSKKVLKIEKTELAFTVLGSLFLPIFLLSIGWFHLLGEYLSVSGEGRFIFGFLSSLVIIPVYISIAVKLSSRLFVWFAYLAVTAGMAFFIATFKLEQDWFYFAFMLYNVLTVLLFHRLKKRETLKLFTEELVAFAQIQLILSSLLTMVFFENHIVNGVNIILTASAYLAMVYVSGRKEYHFVFSAMIVYGAYQLIEHSVLDYFSEVLFVLVGVGFLAIPKFLDDQYHWKNIFQFTSALVSMAAFLYISLEALYTNLTITEPSWGLILSYLLLAGQFIYLANERGSRLFSYLSPIFMTASLYEVVMMLDQKVQFEALNLPIFLIGFALFILFGYFIKVKYLSIIQNSSRDIGIAVMCFSIFFTLLVSNCLELGLMLCLFSINVYLLIQVERRIVYQVLAPWLLPLCLAVAFSAFSEEWRVNSAFYYNNLGLSMNALLGSVVSFLAFFGWKKVNQERLSAHSFVIAQIFYSVAIVFALTLHVNELWMRPLVLLGGIGVYLALYFVKKLRWVPYLVGSISLITYFTIVQSFHMQLQVPLLVQYVEYSFASAVLLLISYSLKNKRTGLASGYAWVGHLFLPISLLFSFFLYGEKSIWSFLLAAILYFASTYLVHLEWKIKTFLYSGFTAVFLMMLTGIMNFQIDVKLQYSFLITSILIAVYWLLEKPSFKQRIVFFFVPFSILGIVVFIGIYPYSLTEFLVTVGYCSGLLWFMSVNKWKVMNVIPLLLVFAATMQFLQLAAWSEQAKLLLVSLAGITLLFVGKLVYSSFHQADGKGGLKELDGYTIIAFLYFASCYIYRPELIWTNLVPGLFISFGFWLQIARVPKDMSVWVKIGAGIYLLEPYYSFISDLNIPELFERETLVIPWVAAIIYLQRCLNGKYKKVMSQIQWAVLIIVSLFLIQDGLESSTIYDALILGTLSLISMLAGIALKVKSYFVVGSGVLLLNVFLQTRPFWGNLPWWAYLLISGSILITVASYNEWHKQKTAKGETTAFTIIKQKILLWINKWD